MTLTEDDKAGGFLGGAIDAPATGATVDVVLGTGQDSPALTGQDILFAARLAGPTGVTVANQGFAVLEANTPSACAGDVRIAYPADIATTRKAGAFVEATLANIEVGRSSVGCTALASESGTIGIECPQVAIRIGDKASIGTLWVRFRAAGSPEVAGSFPGWAIAYVSSMEPPASVEPGGSMTGTVTIDGEDQPRISLGSDDESVVIGPAGATVTYRASWYFGSSEHISQLSVAISDYVGPGVRTTGTIVTLTERVAPGGGFPIEVASIGRGCRVEVAADERSGSTTCTVVSEAPDTRTREVVATWSAAEVRRTVGERVRVTWTIGAAYVSQGEATVLWEVNAGRDPGILWVPDVLVGHPGLADALRIMIRGFSGDGVYSGDAVDPSIQEVRSDSPNLRVNIAPPPGEHPPDEASGWTPIFGACTATVRDGGRAGSITCPGDTHFVDNWRGGPTTLVATWEPA